MSSNTARVGIHAGHLRLLVRLFVALTVALISTPLLLASSASAADSDTCDDIISGEGWQTKVEGQMNDGDPALTVTAPEGFLIDKYCVKTGSSNQGDGPVIVEVDPPASTVTIDHPTKSGVSHFIVHLIAFDECPELPGNQPEGFQCEPLDERETRDLSPVLDCVGGTITVIHEERNRVQEFVDGAWVWGAWSDWTEFDRTVTDAPAEDCAVDNPPPVVDPPAPIIDPPAPIVDPPAETPPTLPNTGSPAMLGTLGLMGALILAAGSTLLMRSRKVRVPRA